MHTQLADLPVILAGLLIVVLIPILAMLCLVLLRRRVGFEVLVVNNEVAGFKYATLGVAYAVLATFLMVSVWEKFEQAEDAVNQEATALMGLFHLAETLPAADFILIERLIDSYLNQVFEVEVPMMRHGGGDYRDGDLALENLGRTVLDTVSSSELPDPILDGLIEAYVDIIQARRERVVAAQGTLPEVLWWLVVVGGLITVGFTFFFASQNVVAQAAMTGLLSIVIMSLVFVTVMMNHPFVGDIAIDLSPYDDVVRMVEGSG